MIVIAHNNGREFLPKLIESLGDLPYAVVDTGSTDPDSLRYLLTLKNVLYTKGGWSLGAYKHAVKNIKADWYFFMHDSMTVKNKNFIDKFSKYDVCGWLSFPMSFDNSSQESYIRTMYNNITERGCFGPIFYAKREAIEKIGWENPETIDQAHGMERGIPCAFKDVGYDMKFIEELDENKLINGYEDFTKCRPQRA